MKPMSRRRCVAVALLVTFVVTLVTGVVLHLKAHGMLIEPRQTIKLVHWIAGLAMVVFALWYYSQYVDMLRAMRAKFPWFWLATWLTALVGLAVFVTGMVKLLSPVKIPNLGLWHYWIGIVMSVAAMLHLVRGIRSLFRR